MSRLRIVIDTNVVVSAALKASGLEAQLVELSAYRVFDLFVSGEMLSEYQGVLARPKFSAIDSQRVERLLSLIAAVATVVVPTKRLTVSEHEEDNRFYECAEAARADYIITGNIQHFKKPYGDTKIVNARQFIELLKKAGEQ